MKYFITGVGGQLGYDIKEELLSRGENNIVAPTTEELDIINREAVLDLIKKEKPDVIFHCAAYTAVDNAEDDREKCLDVNVEGTKNIVDASILVDAKILFMSTDYVYDGKKDSPYVETDDLNPQSVYGESKVLAEKEVVRNPKHYITRISWVFGKNGKNFIKTMLNLSKTRDTLNVVCDQIGSPTYTKDLSKLLVDMAHEEKYGIYHVTNEGYCSWAEFADAIFEKAGKNMTVNHIESKDYPQKATRPKNSRMNKDKLKENFYSLPTWEDALDRYLKEIKDVI